VSAAADRAKKMVSAVKTLVRKAAPEIFGDLWGEWKKAIKNASIGTPFVTFVVFCPNCGLIGHARGRVHRAAGGLEEALRNFITAVAGFMLVCAECGMPTIPIGFEYVCEKTLRASDVLRGGEANNEKFDALVQVVSTTAGDAWARIGRIEKRRGSRRSRRKRAWRRVVREWRIDDREVILSAIGVPLLSDFFEQFEKLAIEEAKRSNEYIV